LLVPLVQGSVRGIRKKALQVQQEHTPLAPIPEEMPVKLFLQTAIGPVKAFLLLAGSVVIYHARAIKGYQDLVAQGLMDLPVCHVGSVNRAHLPPLPKGKV
jgi:hypothetical protein